MDITIIGSRGIPAKYGGYEVFAEEISTRLVKKGINITVCCEHNNLKMRSYKGVKLENFPHPPPNNYALRKFYEIYNDIYFMVKMSQSSDVMYVLGTTAGSMLFLPKLLNWKLRTLVNIGGLEWKRDKWSRLDKSLLWLNTKLAIVFVDVVVVDSKAMEKYVGHFGRHKTVFIPYGAEASTKIAWDKNRLNDLASKCNKIKNIEENNYWLEIARLEPDNNIHVVLEAYLKSQSEKPLVVVGDYTSAKYERVINKILEYDLEKKIFMVGPIYENKMLLDMLRDNCFAYIHAHSYGGTNPSLLEAMASRNIIIAHDNEFNREVCDGCAIYFKDSEDLKNKIELIENNTEDYHELKNGAYNRITDEYLWDQIAQQYELLFSYNDLKGDLYV